MSENAPVILNLGCGTRTSPRAINIDWSIYLRVRQSRIASFLAPILLKDGRLERLRSLDTSIVVHDLRKGIPAADNSADAVYHSHVLEHIDRDQIAVFFAEIYRVLKPEGVHRIVVPDFGRSAEEYVRSLQEQRPNHDAALAPLLEQAVRREAAGTSQQSPARRRLENLALGDARKRGETHQWAFDHVNLRQHLEDARFQDFQVVGPDRSAIPDWPLLRLERNADGTVHKPGSLRVESRKPPNPR